MKKQKTIVIAGGAGFLASHLSQRLVNAGHNIICLDNLYTGRKENIYDLMQFTNFTFIEHDIINPIKLENVDLIFNFACPASPPHYQKDPIFTTKTNVIGTLNLLELARSNNARILQASTSEVYGKPEKHPQPESYVGHVNPCGIRACYDEGKRCAESLVFDYQRVHGLEVKVIRIFNTYGPNMNPDDGRVVSNFITQALENKPITIFGTGKQTRSFCYVDDLIDGILLMMNSDESFTGPVNLGNPNEINLLDLANIVLELTQSKSEITYHKLPSDDPTRRRPDISLARKELGWNPKIGLQDGLKRTIGYFAEVLIQRENEQRFVKKQVQI